MTGGCHRLGLWALLLLSCLVLPSAAGESGLIDVRQAPPDQSQSQKLLVWIKAVDGQASHDLLLRGELRQGLLHGRPQIEAWRSTDKEPVSCFCEQAEVRLQQDQLTIVTVVRVTAGAHPLRVELKAGLQEAAAEATPMLPSHLAAAQVTALHGRLFKGSGTGTLYQTPAGQAETSAPLNCSIVAAIQPNPVPGGPWSNLGNWPASVQARENAWQIETAVPANGLPLGRHVDLRLHFAETVDAGRANALQIDYQVGPGAEALPYRLQLASGSGPTAALAWFTADNLLRTRPGRHRVVIPFSALRWRDGNPATRHLQADRLAGVGFLLQAGRAKFTSSILLENIQLLEQATTVTDTQPLMINFDTRRLVNGRSGFVTASLSLANQDPRQPLAGQRGLLLTEQPSTGLNLLRDMLEQKVLAIQVADQPVSQWPAQGSDLQSYADRIGQLGERLADANIIALAPSRDLTEAGWHRLQHGMVPATTLLRRSFSGRSIAVQLDEGPISEAAWMASAEVAAAACGDPLLWFHDRGPTYPSAKGLQTAMRINRQLSLLCRTHHWHGHRLLALSQTETDNAVERTALRQAFAFVQELGGELVSHSNGTPDLGLIATRDGDSGALLLVNRLDRPQSLRCQLPGLQTGHCRTQRRLYLSQGRISSETADLHLGEIEGGIELDLLLPEFGVALITFDGLPPIGFEERHVIRFASDSAQRALWPLQAGERRDLQVVDGSASPDFLRFVAEDLQDGETSLMLGHHTIPLPSTDQSSLRLYRVPLPDDIEVDRLVLQCGNSSDGCLLASLAFEWVSLHKVYKSNSAK